MLGGWLVVPVTAPHNGGMGRWSDVRIGDITAALARYRPVVVVAAAIALIVAVAPGPRYSRPEAVDTSFETADGFGSVSSPTTVPPAPGVGATDPALDRGDLAAPAPSFDTSFGGGSSFGGASSFDSGSSGDFDSGPSGGSSFDGDESEAAPDTSFEPTPPALVGADPGDGSKLGVVASGWASATAGTPLGADGVPDGSLPVGKRIGQDDKRSYVKLAGQGVVLSLREKADGNRAPVGPGPVIVRACKATAEWQPGENLTFDQIPFDPDACVDGRREADGSWTFDLGSFPAAQRVDTKGFALVPGGTDAAIDYQVAFIR